MKKMLFMLAALPAFLISCSKTILQEEVKNPKEDVLYNLEFKTNDFAQSIVPMSLKADLTQKKAIVMESDSTYYLIRMLIYKDGNLVKSIEQDSYRASPALYKIQLPAGRYKIAFLATSEYLGEANTTLSDISRSNPINLNPVHSHIPSFTAFNNRTVYYKSDYRDFDVSKDSIYDRTTLSAMHSKVILKSTSSKPSSVRYVLIRTKGSSVIYPFWDFKQNDYTYTGASSYSYFSFDMQDLYDKNLPAIVFNTYRFDPFQKSPMMVSFYDEDKSLLGSKTIDNIDIQPRHITTLEGDLYSDLNNGSDTPASNDFKAIVDTKYSNEQINIKF